MPRRDNSMNFRLGCFMFVPRQRLVIHKRKRVFLTISLQAKQRSHGCNGDKDPRVRSVVRLASYLFYDSNYAEIHSVQQNG